MKFGIAKLNEEGTQVAVIASGKRIAEAPSWNEAVAQLVKAFTELAPEETEQTEETTGAAFHAEFSEKDEARDSGGMTRVWDDNSIRLERDPIPVMLLTDTPEFGGHGGAELATMGSPSRSGSIISIDGNFYTGSEVGQEAERLVSDGILTTHSPDFIDAEYEEEVTEIDDDGWPTKFNIRFTDCMLGGITITPLQGFDSAFIKLADAAGEAPPAASDTEREPVSDSEGNEEETVAASGGPVAPPGEWFEDPVFAEPTPFTIDDSGRISGYLALKGECHVGFQDRCVMAPSSKADYAYFKTGALRPGDCDCDIPVGVITMSTGHAGLQLSHRAAAEHYDNTGMQVADVTVGEDDRGIWVAGALRSGLTDEQVRALKASSLSGDWRPIRGGLELVGVLAVNVPGFPVPRARVASGELEALVAAGGGPLAKLKERSNDPMMSRLTALETEVAALETEVAELKRTQTNLRPVEVEQIRKRVAS